MKISVRMEGGLGDHFAANRFIPAIKELHPNCEIDLYSDTEGKQEQSNILKKFWPSYFNDIHVIDSKKFKQFKIKSTNFGEENYIGSIKNIPDEIYHKMTKDYDKFYDLHIDSLDWLNHDYAWLKYFNFFSAPERSPEQEQAVPFDNFILAHLYARDDADSNMESWYINKLLKNISKDFNVIVLYDDNSKKEYEELISQSIPNLRFTHASLSQIFYLSSKCTAMFGIDSGIRYIPYHFGKPVFTFSKYCKVYGKTQYSYLIRWLFNEKFVFPLHFEVSSAGEIIKNTLRNPAYKLYPFLLNDIEKLVAQRNITEYISQ